MRSADRVPAPSTWGSNRAGRGRKTRSAGGARAGRIAKLAARRAPRGISVLAGRSRGAFFCLLLAATVVATARAQVEASSQPPPPLDATTIARIDSLRIGYQAEAALTEIRRLVPRARAARDSSFLLEMLLRQGELETSVGRPARGEPPLREAMSLAEARGDSLLLCASTRWLAVAIEDQGRIDEAAGLCRQLLSLAQAIGDRRHEGWSLVGLAWHASFRGHDAEAERDYRQAVACLDETEDRRGQIWARNGLGVTLERLARYDEARECYEQVLELAEALGHSPLGSMARNNLGSLAFALGDPGTALDHFEQALEQQRRIGNQRGAFEPALNVAICQSRLGRYRDAEATLEKLQEDCRTLGYRQLQGIVLNQQADISLRKGLCHRAAGLNRRTLALGDVVPLKTRAEAQIGLARALATMDSSAAALSVLERGVEEIRGSGLTEGELALRKELGRLLQTAGRHEEALRHLRHVDGEAARLGLTGHRVESLAWAARSHHARGMPDSSLALLREAGRIWLAERDQPLDPEWREQRGVSGHLLYTDLASLTLERGDRSEAERVREAFDQLQIFKARTLLERMLGPYGGAVAGDSVRGPDPITLEELQRHVLRDGELFLDAYLGPERSFLFAVTRDSCRAARLPAENELTEQLVFHHGFLAHPPDPGVETADGEILRSAGRRLGDLLFAGVRDLLDDCDLVLYAPDGSLNLLSPISLAPEATPDEAGSGFDWVRVPSATVLAYLRQREPPEGASPPRQVLALAGRETPSGESLYGAVREVRHLGRRFRGVDVRILDPSEVPGSGAITADVLADYDVLHIAAHAGLDDQYPWRSAIRLTSDGDRGRLLASEIASARLAARMAVLAACDSGSGRVLSGEGVLGLSSAFLSAGVPAVLATLWPVDDAATASLMRVFYGELAGGQRASTALRRAQASLRSDPTTAHPFFWAGFVLIGDGEVRVPLEYRPVVPWLSGVALAVVIGLMLLPVAARRLGRSASDRFAEKGRRRV
jgi:tetratricopeptide (TPR) repeat protein